MSATGEAALHGKALVNTFYRAVRLYAADRSPRSLRQAGRYVMLRLAGAAPPVTITIAPTFRCQCRCVHCFAAVAGRDGRAELTTEEVECVLRQARGLGTLNVIFTGGEPLLRADLARMVACAHRLGLLTRVSTNGGLLTRERVHELKQAGLNQCGVSIDRPDAAEHDRLRGLPGTFERAMDGIRYLHQAGIYTKILVCASRPMVTEGLERVIDMGRRLKVMAVYIILPVAAGRWDEAYEEALTPGEQAQVRGLQDPAFVHMELPAADSDCCAYVKGTVYVAATGEVTPCPYVPYAMGDIRREPLADIWRRHASALRLHARGQCPMNTAPERDALRTHTGWVRRAGPSAPAEGAGD